MKGLESLEGLLARKEQRFVCVDTNWPEPGPERFTAHIVHHTEPPLDKTQLDRLGRLFGGIPQLTALYGRYGSVRLFVDTIGGDSAFYIATPDEWHGLKKGFAMWLDVVDHDEQVIPDGIDDYVVIGEIPASGNYFLLPTKGEQSGKVILFDHDGYEFIERGADLSDFLQYISTVDDSLIEDILTNTRYSDGETGIQWLADQFLYDD